MTIWHRIALTVCVVAAFGASARAQDLYDTTVLRTMNFEFVESNWEALLRSNYASQTNLLGTLTVDGVAYPNVGVRIRGNTSYTALPAGSQKFSLNVELDAVDLEQDLLGYSSLNLNNGFHDPTFCREVLYNNYVAQFMPNPRANHVVVTINGASWGVYINVQQFNKTMLSTHFADTSGLRIKCANNPNGPGLTYNGTSPAGYAGYEIKDPGGFVDPWPPHIAVCNAVTNGVVANWATTIDPVFAVDPSIWSAVFENILTDDDSYINKGADFMTYRNPTDGRTYLLQTDANETFTQTTWAPTRNFAAANKPVLSRVLTVAELRQRYFAHYRTAKADLTWAYFEPRATAMRSLIDAAVQADTKKLYTYAQFQTNFTSAVTLSGMGPGGGTVPGLQTFLTQRTTTLNATAELTAVGPTISAVTPSESAPDPFDPVSITATVAPAGSAISKVELFYRPSPAGVYQRVLMTGNGSGQYTAPLAVAATPGQRVAYYVAATAANAFGSLTFHPTHTEWDPLVIEYTFGASGGMRITEWMYSGTAPAGEFIEFTNISSAPIDMTGWSFDDDHAVAGAFSLSAFGSVAPGESVVLTEVDAAAFRGAWSLPPTVKVIGGMGSVASGGNNLARNDEINLFDSTGLLVDRLTFGDQSFPGTIRTQNFSGQTCGESVGQDDVAAWVRSAVGDLYGSFASAGGEVGTPGSYSAPSCFPCAVPNIGTHPLGQTICSRQPATLSVVSTGTGPLGYAWQVETLPAGSGNYISLADGPLAGIGTVAGSTTASISISDLAYTGGASFRCVVTNACGDATSNPATLALCAADFNCSGGVTVQDIFDFLGGYFASDASADFNGVGGVTVQDIFDYLGAYFLGCS